MATQSPPTSTESLSSSQLRHRRRTISNWCVQTLGSTTSEVKCREDEVPNRGVHAEEVTNSRWCFDKEEVTTETTATAVGRRWCLGMGRGTIEAKGTTD
ncbi:hypothetical protein AKJ16_DCAP12808 [Drosera capensis]